MPVASTSGKLGPACLSTADEALREWHVGAGKSSSCAEDRFGYSEQPSKAQCRASHSGLWDMRSYANVNEGRAGPDALPDDPGEMFAGSADRGPHFGDAVGARGGTPRVAATGMWGYGEAEVQARLQTWSQPISHLARQDREDLRNMEAILWTAPDAMARPRQSRRPGPPHRHRLQPQTDPIERHGSRLIAKGRLAKGRCIPAAKPASRRPQPANRAPSMPMELKHITARDALPGIAGEPSRSRMHLPSRLELSRIADRGSECRAGCGEGDDLSAQGEWRCLSRYQKADLQGGPDKSGAVHMGGGAPTLSGRERQRCSRAPFC